MLKQELIKAYEQLMNTNNFTYKDLCKLSGLSQSQIANILKHGAENVSIERMERGLYRLGFGIEIDYYNLEEGE